MALYPEPRPVGLEQLTLAKHAVLRSRWAPQLTQAEKARLEDMAREIGEMQQRRTIPQRITGEEGA